jgi:hypothetical protein
MSSANSGVVGLPFEVSLMLVGGGVGSEVSPANDSNGVEQGSTVSTAALVMMKVLQGS